MTQEEMKVVITAETSKFSKAINNIKNSIKGISTSNVGKGFDSATASVGNFEKQFSKAMENVNRTTKRTSEQVRQKWLAEMDRLIGVTRLKLAQMSQNFEKSGYTSDYWAEQIDSGDAYLRKLEQFRKAFAEGMVDVPEVQGFEHFSEEVENALSSIEKMDLQMEATINLETGDLKSAEGSLQAIELCLEQIEKLKADPLDREAIIKIRQYRKQIDALASSWAKANKVATANKYNELLSQYPDLYARIQQSTQNLQTPKKSSKNSSPDFSKMAGTITRALIGVRSLFFFVRKIAAQNDFLQFAVQAMFETIAGALKPLLDFIARVILGLAKIIGRIFGVAVGVSGSASATADNTGKMVTIASFDELETLNKAMSGGSGEGGVDGGYDSLLKKIDEKLGWIYKIIDKLKGTIQKADLPNDDDIVEGIIASGAAGSQSPSGIGFSWGTNKDNEQIEAVYEAWEDAKIDFILELPKKIWKNWVQYNNLITEDTIKETDKQVENWRHFFDFLKNNNSDLTDYETQEAEAQKMVWDRFKENVKQKWEELKTNYKSINEQMTQNQIQQTDAQVERWRNFFTRVKEIWEQIKIGFSNTWQHITDGVSQAVTKAKTLIGTIADKVGELAGNAWSKIRGFGNTIIEGVESAINNLVWGINNSAFLTNFNKLFKTNIWLSYVGIPRLANGGVLTTPTVAQLGEYPGANSNPEIATPRSLMLDTMNESNSQLAGVFAQVGRQIIDAINNKDLEVQIGDSAIAKSAQRGNKQWEMATGKALW